MSETDFGVVRLRVFLSYSRRDLAFARELRDQLIAENFDAYIDVEDIVKGEPWRERLGRLIEGADAVLFLVSPASVASDICGWEVNEAERLGKRILPVVVRPTPDEDIPGRLTRLNYTFLDAPGKRAAEFAGLLNALRQDAVWVREHTRLAELAARWRNAGQPSRLLLRGADISAAEAWRDGRPAQAPDPTEEHRAFITASRRGAARRLRWWVAGSATAAIGAAVLAVLALLGRQEAQTQRARAEKNAVEARQERDGALLTQSRFLADLARQSCSQADAGACGALALEALPDPQAKDPRPYAPEAEAVLLEALTGLRERRLVARFDAPIRAIGLGPDAAWLAVLTRTEHQTGRVADPQAGERSGRVTLIDAQTGAVISKLDEKRANSDPLSLSVDPNSGRIALGDRDGRVRIYDAVAGALLQVITPDNGQPLLVTRFSADGRFLVAAGGVRADVFDGASGAPVAVLDHRVAGITNAAFAPRAEASRRDIAITTSDGYVTRWRLAADASEVAPQSPAQAQGARLVARQQGASGWATAAAFGAAEPPGALLGMIFANADGRISAPALKTVWTGHSAAIRALATTPDWFASASSDGTARLWPLASLAFETDAAVAMVQSRSLRLAGHTGAVTALTFAKGGSLLTGGVDGTVRTWTAEPVLAPLPLGGRKAFCVNKGGFAQDGTAVLVGCGDGSVRLWRVADRALLWTSEALPGVQPGLSLSPDGSHAVAVASAGSLARIFTLDGGPTQLAEITAASLSDGAEAQIRRGALAPGGRRAAFALQDGAVLLWDLDAARVVARVNAHTKAENPGRDISALVFSSDGRRLVSAAKDGAVTLIDGATGAEIARLPRQGAAVWDVAFTPDAARFVTISGSGAAAIWQAETGTRQAMLPGHRRAIFDAAISPDGLIIATAGFEGVRLFDANTGKLRLKIPSGRTDAVAFATDGARIAAAGPGFAVTLYDIQSGAALGTLPHKAAVSHLAFSPRTGSLISFAPMAQIWPLPSDTRALIALARSTLPRCIDAPARKAAFLDAEAPGWCAELSGSTHR